MEVSTIIIGLVTSIVANLIFSYKLVLRYISEYRRQLIMLKFWKTQTRQLKKAYIFYPSYPNPRVGRTEKKLGFYLSDEDAKAVELLEKSLTDIGFRCQRIMLTENFDTKQPIPKDGIAVLVCGPKLDLVTNRIVYDPWTGGSPISSWFYLRFNKVMGVILSYDGRSERKEYDVQDFGKFHSPQDERPEKDFDTGLLIRFEVDQQYFYLCWGIHGPGTLGTVKASLEPSILKKLPLKSADIIAKVDSKIDKNSGDVTVTAVGRPLKANKDIPSDTKPNPFKIDSWLPAERQVYGLSYLWATEKNIKWIKTGKYKNITPVAAELDLSLKCIYDCSWCPYREDRKNIYLDDGKKGIDIVNRLSQFGVKLIVLTGGGEPLVSPCVETVVETCRKNKMLVTLYTNGFLLNDTRAFYIMSRGVSEIRISLDDVSSNENYNNIHGLPKNKLDALETVKKNVQRLISLRTRNGFGTRIGASFLISDNTIHNLTTSAKNLRKWIERVGPFDYIVVRPAVNYWPGGDAHNRYFSRDADSKENLTEALEVFKDGVARHLIVSWQRFRDLGEIKHNSGYDKCLSPLLWMNIGPDGSAYLCCETKHKHNFLLGNILTDSLDKLFKSSVIKQRMTIPFGSAGCPVLLCKPSMLNLLFNNIEKRRSKKDSRLPLTVVKWLDEVAKYSCRTGVSEMFIPSVSGIYEEY